MHIYIRRDMRMGLGTWLQGRKFPFSRKNAPFGQGGMLQPLSSPHQVGLESSFCLSVCHLDCMYVCVSVLVVCDGVHCEGDAIYICMCMHE